MFIKPDFNLESIYEIDFERLKSMGIKGLIFDLDSTIMVSRSCEYTDKTKQWLKNAQKEFAIAVVSNNNNKQYLEKVRAISNFPVYGSAAKPNPKIMCKAFSDLNLSPNQAAVVGDRPLTDILGGKKAKAGATILVGSINAQNEGLPTKFVRFLERLTIRK